MDSVKGHIDFITDHESLQAVRHKLKVYTNSLFQL